MHDASKPGDRGCCQPVGEREDDAALRRAAARTEVIDGVEVWTPPDRFFIDHGLIHDRETGKHVRAETFDGLFDGEVAETVEMLNGLWGHLVSLYRDYQQVAALASPGGLGREEQGGSGLWPSAPGSASHRTDGAGERSSDEVCE